MNQLELDMRAFTRELYDWQIAFLFKVPEEMQQTPCDFFGFTRSGRAVLIECKQIKAKSLKINNSPGLLPHQWRALRQAHLCGAISLVVWRNCDETTVVTYDQCNRAAEGRRSIPWNKVRLVGPWEERLSFILAESGLPTGAAPSLN